MDAKGRSGIVSRNERLVVVVPGNPKHGRETLLDNRTRRTAGRDHRRPFLVQEPFGINTGLAAGAADIPGEPAKQLAWWHDTCRVACLAVDRDWNQAHVVAGDLELVHLDEA